VFKKGFLVITLLATSISYSIDYKAVPGSLLGIGGLGISLYNGSFVLPKIYDDFIQPAWINAQELKVQAAGAYVVVPAIAGLLNLYYANSSCAEGAGFKHASGCVLGLGVCAVCIPSLHKWDLYWWSGDRNLTRLVVALQGLSLLYYANQYLLRK